MFGILPYLIEVSYHAVSGLSNWPAAVIFGASHGQIHADTSKAGRHQPNQPVAEEDTNRRADSAGNHEILPPLSPALKCQDDGRNRDCKPKQ